MKYIINNQLTDFANYKEYKHYTKLTEDEQFLISEEQKEYALCYYCIENNNIIHVARERRDFLLSDNCRIATQEEVDKLELQNLKSQIIDNLLSDYRASKQNVILLAQGQRLNFAKDVDNAIEELNFRVSGNTLVGLEMLQTLDNLKVLLNRAIGLRHAVRSNVAEEQGVVLKTKTLKTLKEYKPTLRVVFDAEIEILDLLK